MKYFYVLGLFLTMIMCDEHTHTYKKGEQVVLWMNTLNPYHNHQETYDYFSLPFCVGTEEIISDHQKKALSEALQGITLVFSGLDMTFPENVTVQEFCTIKLDVRSYKAFVYAVKNDYWYQMYIDDLPIWGTVGQIYEDNYYIWSHKKFDIAYNENRIVEVNLTTENKILLKPDAKIPFTYEVNWKKSNISFEDRFDKYLNPNIFERIHWFSIFNSFMMVIFLVGLISMVLMRTLRKDYARYSIDGDLGCLEKDLGNEYGWKQIHGDVFRAVPHLPVFCALIGTGYQLTVVTLAVIIFTIFNEFYKERGSLLPTVIFIYVATSPINGYFSGSLYARMGGKMWMKQMLLSAFLLPVLVCGTTFFNNFIAMYYNVSRVISSDNVITIMSICTFVILPLTWFGTIFGRNLAGQPDYPCNINDVPRPIPEKKWFLTPPIIIIAGGILPFGSIFIEMYFIFTTFWEYKIYNVYGLMLLVFVILLIVTICDTIVFIYFLLNAEDYRWQWISFLSAGSIALYIYLYSFYYFIFKTTMYGLFQTAFYFSYMALFSVALGIVCGTLGYVGASIFVRNIYSTLKIEYIFNVNL